MKIFLLSIIAIGSVQSLAIGYPYRSGYWTYNPVSGEFPQQTPVVQRYLRYYDNSGNERLVTYSYPEPVYTQQQISYVAGSSSPVYRTYTQEEFNKAYEAHFRVWSLQQYQALKCEIDALRALGKEPSSDMLSKFKPLEKIALTTDYSTIAYLPEIKRIREEHLKMWNEAQVKNLQSNTAGTTTYQLANVASNQGELKTYNSQSGTALVSLGETPQQKQTREENSRIYNEQIASLKKFELEHQQQQQNKDFSLRISQLEQKPIEQQSQYTDAISELERANQEHFRLWNEAKLRAEQTNDNLQGISNKGYVSADKQLTSALKGQYTPIEQQQQQPIVDTPEVIKAREDHLRLVNEAKLRVEQAEQQELKHKTQPIEQLERETEFKLRTEQLDSADHSKAHEEHLRLVNEATLKIKAAEEHIKQLGANQIIPGQFQTQSHLGYEQQQHIKSSISGDQQQPHQVVDTPEVVKAREEHLRLVEEAYKRVKQAEQHELKYQSQSIAQPSQYVGQQQDSADHLKAREEHLRLVNEATLKIQAAEEHIKQLSAQQDTTGKIQTESRFGYEQQHLKTSNPAEQQQPHQVADTPEVIKAREEHLRLVNEAKAQSVDQQELKYKQENKHESQQVPLFKAEVQHQPIHHQHHQQLHQHEQSQFLQDTPEVVKAREEHFRLVNEAKLNEAQNVQYNKEQQPSLKYLPIDYQQQSFQHQHDQSQHIQDTPEVIKAREEHLRLVNEAKLSIKSGDQNIHYHTEQQSNVKSHLPHEYQQHHQINQHTSDTHHPIGDTPEVQKARAEHLFLVNAIKEQEESKMQGIIKLNEQLNQITEEEQRLLEERRILELQGLREAELLQEEHKKLDYEAMQEAERLAEEQRQIEAELQRLKIEEQNRLELEDMREATRLAEEQRQMSAELQRLKLEEEQRLEMERILEAKSLQEEQGELKTETIQQSQSPQVFAQYQPYFYNNPLKSNPINAGVANNLLQQQQQQQIFTNNPFFKTSFSKTPSAAIISTGAAVQSSNTAIPVVRYIQSSQQFSAGSPSPNTAEALQALENATNDHYRAHELALERLRLAKHQNSKLNDCN